VAQSESWTLGPRAAQVELRAPCGAQPKLWVPHGGAAEVDDEGAPQGLAVRQPTSIRGRSIPLGSRSDHQPLF
jgi:hypothetical protein